MQESTADMVISNYSISGKVVKTLSNIVNKEQKLESNNKHIMQTQNQIRKKNAWCFVLKGFIHSRMLSTWQAKKKQGAVTHIQDSKTSCEKLQLQQTEKTQAVVRPDS